MRVNLGCGTAYMRGWTNVDSSEDVLADIHLDARAFVELHGHETTELYMGHFIEHFMPLDVLELLQAMIRRLPMGAEVSAVVPDICQIFTAYQMNEMNNRELNEWYIYSYIQPSRHVWCHDEGSLTALFQEAGFLDVVPIEPSTWPPVWHKDGLGARFQSGVRGIVPARATNSQPEHADSRSNPDGSSGSHPEPIHTAVETTDERLSRLVRMVAVEAYRRNEVDAELAAVRAQLDAVRAQLDALVHSRSFRLANTSRVAVRALVPTGTIRARVVRSTVKGALKLSHPTRRRE